MSNEYTEQADFDAISLADWAAHAAHKGTNLASQTTASPIRIRFGDGNDPSDGWLLVWINSLMNATGSGSKGIVDWVTREERNLGADLSVPEIIALIRTIFSLNVTELAAAMKVERPTIYSWAAGKTLPHASNMRRLFKLLQLANFLTARAPRPLGRAVREIDETDESIATLLAHETINDERVQARLRTIIDKFAHTSRRLSPMESAAKHGINTMKYKRNQDGIDGFTGKRIEPESET